MLATSLFPAPYRSTPPPAGGSPLVPPISSPAGSIFGCARQIAPSSRSLGSSSPSLANSRSLAPYRSTPPPAGVPHLVPPISSPWGSIPGIAHQTPPHPPPFPPRPPTTTHT